MDSSKTKSEIAAHNKAYQLAQDTRSWSKPISVQLSILSDSWTDYEIESATKELLATYQLLVDSLKYQLASTRNRLERF